jgi:hypothetical protein
MAHFKVKNCVCVCVCARVFINYILVSTDLETGKSGIFMDTQHPMGRAGMEKIADLERDLADKTKQQDVAPKDDVPCKPEFIVPLAPQYLVEESKSLHLECQVEPKTDPALTVEWFLNGKQIDAGELSSVTNMKE